MRVLIFPQDAPRRFLAPLLALAVFGVLLTAGTVAWLVHTLIALPLAASFVLGAIVAPPDAAAASAVLRGVSIPRSTFALLQGESLFNDSTALLIFSAALAVLETQGLKHGLVLRLGAAVPGGVLFGIVSGYLAFTANRFVQGTLGGNLLQFILAYAVWIIASHLELSAVLATVAFAMTIARRTTSVSFGARMRVQSYAVWSVVVFTLNVFAFMLMGMQARSIIGRMAPGRLRTALLFACLITAGVIVVRLLVVLIYNRVDALWERAHHRPERASIRQALLVGWCGMRGFVTMAAALSLPQNFPQRDTVVLIAFIVVLATLALQGATLAPVIRLLGLEQGMVMERERSAAKARMTQAAQESLSGETSLQAENPRYQYSLVEQTCGREDDPTSLRIMLTLGLRAVTASRKELEAIRLRNEISVDGYLALQEQTDWRELTLVSDDDRRIEEI